MALRKSPMKSAPPRPQLERLLAWAREVGVTDEEFQAQRASFAYGNASATADRITRESAREAALRNRLIRA